MSASGTKAFVIATVALFVILFNLGYVFHDLLLGEWFHRHEPYAREHFIIPLIAATYFIYCLILAYLYPIYRQYYAASAPYGVGLRFGLLMGVMFDALQGGLIEVATLPMPWIVFFVDTGYHVLVEGTIIGLILAWVHERWAPRRA